MPCYLSSFMKNQKGKVSNRVLKSFGGMEAENVYIPSMITTFIRKIILLISIIFLRPVIVCFCNAETDCQISQILYEATIGTCLENDVDLGADLSWRSYLKFHWWACPGQLTQWSSSFRWFVIKIKYDTEGKTPHCYVNRR